MPWAFDGHELVTALQGVPAERRGRVAIDICDISRDYALGLGAFAPGGRARRGRRSRSRSPRAQREPLPGPRVVPLPGPSAQR